MGRMNRSGRLIGLAGTILLTGCQSAPPMSKERFAEAARRCRLKATTYTYRDGFLLDEPLVDFSREPNPGRAMSCFRDALEQIDRAMMERGVDHISYIWEWRS